MIPGETAFTRMPAFAYSIASDFVAAFKPPLVNEASTEGTLLCPDPNFFGNTPRSCGPDGTLRDVDIVPHPFGIANRRLRNGTMQADYRMVGLVDMALAMQQGRAHRASGAMALHVLDVLEALIESSNTRRFIDLATRCERPDQVPLGADESVFA